VRFIGLVNSILRPPLTSQDLSRLMLLYVEPLADDAREPDMGRSHLELLGKQLFRRMLDAWPRFLAEFPRWKAALKQADMPGRAHEQFGILLAAADVALHDAPADSDSLVELAEQVAEGTASDRAEELAEWARCLERMASTIVPAFSGGQQRTLGTLIGMVALQATWKDAETGRLMEWPGADRDNAARALASYGLRVVPETAAGGHPLRRWRSDRDVAREPSTTGDGRMLGWLAVANSHASLNAAVFKGSHYAAASGTSGGWKAALETAPGVLKGREMRFGGPASRCVLVPLDLVLDGPGRLTEGAE
jgi:hypothetical protein